MIWKVKDINKRASVFAFATFNLHVSFMGWSPLQSSRTIFYVHDYSSTSQNITAQWCIF